MSEPNIFVLGLDELNRAELEHFLPRYRFHPLLSVEELTEAEDIDLEKLLAKARRQLESFDGRIDAIIGYWDFPVSSMVPILCQNFGLPAVSLQAVVACEHKYWSRLEQQRVTDAHPAFGIVNLEGAPHPPTDVDFPMWLKPVKGYSSALAFKVHDREEFDAAVEEIRQGIGAMGKPFDYLLSMLELPEEIAAVGGEACLAEAAVTGEQSTVEGYVYHGDVRVQGVIDTVNYADTSSFLRYQYPSQLPTEVRDRLIAISKRVITQMGLDNSTFNIEYFWESDTDTITLLEVNPRLSQSHARLFEAVDGTPNHQSMVRLATGEDPELPYRQGAYPVAGKWFLRRFTDGVVRRVPTTPEIDELRTSIEGVEVEIVPSEGDRLSDLPGQDSYSYELANIFIGAADKSDLTDKYERCVNALHFAFDD